MSMMIRTCHKELKTKCNNLLQNKIRVRFNSAIQNANVENISTSKKNQSIVDRESFEEIYLQNEPMREYRRDSRELFRLEQVIEAMSNTVEDIPIMVNGKAQRSKLVCYQVMPHKKSQKIARFYYATDQQIFKAIDVAKSAQRDWDRTSFSHRLDIWEKAANLMSTKYRAELVAATMLGQAKVLADAEQDAAVDLIDIMRVNSQFLKMLTQWQPLSPNLSQCQNHLVMRGLEGFVAAISPSNSTALGANLAYTPALMGNSVLWKPSDSTILSSWIIYKIMLEAGVPEGLISFVPTSGPVFGQTITHSESLSGINYTGSAATFKKLWKLVAKFLEYYPNFPRLVGECGGKNFHFVHESADPNVVVACTIRSAFEYSGQKRASCTRLYVPQSLWESDIKDLLIEKTEKLKMGDVCDYESFTSAVINLDSFTRMVSLLETAQQNPKFRLLAGGKHIGTNGYFIRPTILQATELHDRIFKDEYCGPLLVVYVYKNADQKRVLDQIANGHALAGSIFARDEQFLKTATDHFKSSVGNLFINDRSTAISVGQQPFGGSRMSGTNDKVGGPYYLLRWMNTQTIKETFVSQTEVCFPTPMTKNELQ